MANLLGFNGVVPQWVVLKRPELYGGGGRGILCGIVFAFSRLGTAPIAICAGQSSSCRPSAHSLTGEPLSAFVEHWFELCRCWPCGRETHHIRVILANLRANSTKLGRRCSDWERARRISGDAWEFWGYVGQANFGQSPANFDQLWANLDGYRVDPTNPTSTTLSPTWRALVSSLATGANQRSVTKSQTALERRPEQRPSGARAAREAPTRSWIGASLVVDGMDTGVACSCRGSSVHLEVHILAQVRLHISWERVLPRHHQSKQHVACVHGSLSVCVLTPSSFEIVGEPNSAQWRIRALIRKIPLRQLTIAALVKARLVGNLLLMPTL